MGGLSVPRSSPLALQTLRDVASISAALREMQQAVRPMAEHGLPAQQSELLATLNAGVGELQQSVAALQSVAAGARASLGGASKPDDGPQPEDLATLRTQAQRLQRETQSQSQVLLLLEEQESGSVERAQEVFALMDVDGDGWIGEEEFLRGATALLTLGKEETERLRADVADRFRKATPDVPGGTGGTGGTGTMDFARFCDFLTSLKGDAIGPLARLLPAPCPLNPDPGPLTPDPCPLTPYPLTSDPHVVHAHSAHYSVSPPHSPPPHPTPLQRVNLADALRRLLDNSLQMTALSLSKELASPDLPPDRAAAGGASGTALASRQPRRPRRPQQPQWPQ